MMKFTKGLEGVRVVLGEEGARWRNYQSAPSVLPSGTVLKLESWRPEGYRAVVESTGEHFFVFDRFIEKAEYAQ